MEFCDQKCCFGKENCSKSGKFFINHSKYHKVCRLHLKEISNSQIDRIICHYCCSKVKIISSIVEESRNTLKSSIILDNTSQSSNQDSKISLINKSEGESNNLQNLLIRSTCSSCNGADDLLTLPCSHVSCQSCKHYCKLCNNNQKCINCNRMAQKLGIYPCTHFLCYHCFEKPCTCKSFYSLKSSCSVCKSKTQTFLRYSKIPSSEIIICRHEKCLNCLIMNKQCEICESQKGKKGLCESCGAFSQIVKSFSCKHQLCSDCLNQNRCSRCLKICQLCLLPLSQKKRLNCKHISCLNCFKSVEECLVCLTNKVMRFDCSKCPDVSTTGGECLICNKFLCRVCDKDHATHHKRLKTCESCQGTMNRLKCSHYSCKKCNKTKGVPCKTCFPETSMCGNCGLLGNRKTVLKCKHQACLKCGNSSDCFSCLVYKKKFKKKLNCQTCVGCKNYLKRIETLACGHFICRECFGPQYRFTNYYCFKCFSNGECMALCLICQNYHMINVDSHGTLIKDCCGPLVNLINY